MNDSFSELMNKIFLNTQTIIDRFYMGHRLFTCSIN